MRYLVTGGAGFIGSHIVERLVREGESVRVIDDFSTGKRENLQPFAGSIEIVEGDIRDFDRLHRALEGVDVVLHQAALPSVPRSIADPLTSNAVNMVGTLNLLEAARRQKTKKIVYASSSSVYGDNPELPKHEGMVPNPLSPYAVSKLGGEKYCQVFARLYGIETIGLRYFNVFGPRQDPNSQYSAVIPKFITAIQRGVRPVIFGDGLQSRDFTFVDNVVEANLLAARAPNLGGVVMNCACSGQVTLNALVEEINRIVGSDVAPIYEAPRPGDIVHSFADIRMIQSKLGFRPFVDFREGLARTVRYYAGAGK